MDVVGVAGIAAEAELLAAICLFLQRVGLGPADVVIKVSSRGVLGAVLTRFGIPADAVGPVAVVVDKMDKLPLAKARGLLQLAVLCCLGDAGSSIQGSLGFRASPHLAVSLAAVVKYK